MEKVQTFQVKEVCEICNITRKTLLVYEEKGLLCPHYVNQDSGYRYYNAENVSKIMHVKKMQSFGFSLNEIHEYLNDTKKMHEVFERLNKLKESLDETIKELRMRMMTEEYDSQEIIKTVFPRRYCYAKRAETKGFIEALNFLRETHLEAIKTERDDKVPKMYTSLLSYDGDTPDLFGRCEMLYCIPMLDGYDGENAFIEEETSALCIFHRGSYSTIAESVKKLLDHIKESDISAAGPMRFIWLEGPPVHGDRKEKYLTQIAVPINE